ncbi:MAG TPA: hypothetical protein DD726_04580 [Phycisphaerales bacterium]|nr:hypothetical protein [Phycisphaerales bacterium]
MKFYNRKNELLALQTLYSQSAIQGHMTVLTGRRRVGKTMLAIEFAHRHMIERTFICPIVFYVIEELKKELGFCY